MDRAINLALKRGQFMIKPLKKIYRRRIMLGQKQAYHAWAVENEQRCFVGSDHIKNAGLISVVVPIYNTDPNDLLNMVYSVVNQHYENWELILVDASSEAHIQKRVIECSQIDIKIQVVKTKNEGIAANTNKGIKEAAGDFIAFLDHDDLLHPCALHCVAQAINQSQGELIYSDEDKISADNGQYFQPLFKPSWSPDLLRNVNYINHLTVIKAEYVRRAGGLHKDFDGAQDYDLLWRVIDKCQPTIIHIPRVLYHWRAAATSTARDFQTKEHVLRAGTKAVQKHLDRNKIAGKAKALKNQPGFYAIDFELSTGISIVIGPVHKNYQRICSTWIQELLSKLPAGLRVELIVGDWYKKLNPNSDRWSVKLITAEENYWQSAAGLVSQPAVVCFQSGATPQNPPDLEKIAAAALRLDSVIGPVVIDARGVIADAGLVESSYGLQKLFNNYKLGEDSYCGTTSWNRNVSALSMQIFAAPKQQFEALASHVQGTKFNPQALKTYESSKNTPTYIIYAQAPFVYKGTFVDPPLLENSYFNPQLAESLNKVEILHSDWGKLKNNSERDNAK